MEKLTVRISVRNLVEFIMRSGNLDNRRGSMDKEAMQKGADSTERYRNRWEAAIWQRSRLKRRQSMKMS